ncbi:MAG: hypothetical protein H6551_05100 [Chitinophagales bacterium]|nr:hypothetical protein [Chitinophagales bacterium]
MKRTFILVTTVLVSVLLAKSGFAQDDELVRVYRWYNTVDQNYVTVAEGEFQEGQLLNWKWNDKTQVFVAYRNPGPDRVAVSRWYNPQSKDYVSVAEDEYTDNDMIKMGYTDKTHQFYALTQRGPNTVAVYRWYVPKNRDWATVSEEGDTDTYYKRGWRRKTFQYYGIKRSVDAPIYNQL